MKENLFTRLFGGGAPTPKADTVSATTREQIINEAEEEMRAMRPVDAYADALNKANERKVRLSIAQLRGRQELPKKVEEVFRRCVGVGISSALTAHGLSILIRDSIKWADILWPMFKASLLSGDAWIERADPRDKSPLTAQEKDFFEKGGSR